MNPNALPEYRRWKSQHDTQPLPVARPPFDEQRMLFGIIGLDAPRQRPSGAQRIALIGAYEQLIMQRRRHRFKMARRREIAEMVLWILAATVLASEAVLLSTLTYILLTR